MKKQNIFGLAALLFMTGCAPQIYNPPKQVKEIKYTEILPKGVITKEKFDSLIAGKISPKDISWSDSSSHGIDEGMNVYQKWPGTDRGMYREYIPYSKLKTSYIEKQKSK